MPDQIAVDVDTQYFTGQTELTIEVSGIKKHFIYIDANIYEMVKKYMALLIDCTVIIIIRLVLRYVCDKHFINHYLISYFAFHVW